MQKLRRRCIGLSKNSSAQAAAERQKLAQNLSDLAKQAQELGKQMPNLDAAIAALQANQTENFQKDMDMAHHRSGKGPADVKSLAAKQKSVADREGKDLAEQLKFGQPELAGQTLGKMIDQLRSGKMTAGAERNNARRGFARRVARNSLRRCLAN